LDEAANSDRANDCLKEKLEVAWGAALSVELKCTKADERKEQSWDIANKLI
jgi:hypothetical protein